MRPARAGAGRPAPSTVLQIRFASSSSTSSQVATTAFLPARASFSIKSTRVQVVVRLRVMNYRISNRIAAHDRCWIVRSVPSELKLSRRCCLPNVQLYPLSSRIAGLDQWTVIRPSPASCTTAECCQGTTASCIPSGTHNYLHRAHRIGWVRPII